MNFPKLYKILVDQITLRQDLVNFSGKIETTRNSISRWYLPEILLMRPLNITKNCKIAINDKIYCQSEKLRRNLSKIDENSFINFQSLWHNAVSFNRHLHHVWNFAKFWKTSVHQGRVSNISYTLRIEIVPKLKGTSMFRNN